MTYEDATTRPDAYLWADVLKSELEVMEFQKVWDVVSRNRKIKTIPTKWLFSEKSDGKKKARIVAVGCRDSLKDRFTPEEKASPTPPSSVILWALSHAVSEEWEIVQLDIKKRFSPWKNHP